VPFLQAAATAGGRGVLGDKDRMIPHGRLLAIVGRLGGGQTVRDEAARVVQHRRHPALPQVEQLPAPQPKPAAKGRSAQRREQSLSITHRQPLQTLPSSICSFPVQTFRTQIIVKGNEPIVNRKESEMTRKEMYKDIEQTLGIVPTMFKSLPDSSLKEEWELFKRVQIEEGPIPQKYRELIGLGIAAVTKCRYCALYHTEAARMNGATDEEIADALEFAKASAGWSTWINGMQVDYDEFRTELQQIGEGLDDLLRPYLDRAGDRSKRPDGARLVSFIRMALPTDEPDAR
jgi:AhpD family alkylhydroperoxidase